VRRKAEPPEQHSNVSAPPHTLSGKQQTVSCPSRQASRLAAPARSNRTHAPPWAGQSSVMTFAAAPPGVADGLLAHARSTVSAAPATDKIESAARMLSRTYHRGGRSRRPSIALRRVGLGCEHRGWSVHRIGCPGVRTAPRATGIHPHRHQSAHRARGTGAAWNARGGPAVFSRLDLSSCEGMRS
jgi:hypothetical protein